MNRIRLLYSSLIGKKILAALSGLVLFGFLVGHVTGNLKAFNGIASNGVPHIDIYGHFLRIVGEPLVPKYFLLWSARIVLILAIVVHVVVVAQLALINRQARPQGYAKKSYSASSLPARYMLISGFAVFAFIIFHLLHFTTGTIVIGQYEEGSVYSNLYFSFVNWPVALLYAVMMIVLGTHLFHGTWSLFQTLGLDNPDRNRFLRGFAWVMSVALVLGFSAVPLAFMSGSMSKPVEYARELLTGASH